MIPDPIRHHLGSRKGWRASATSLGLGLVSALALPPVHLVPLLWLCVPGLLVLLATAPTIRAGFWRGYAFGFGHNLAGLYWISIALLTEADRFGWLVPLAVPAIAALLALFVAVPCLVWAWVTASDRPRLSIGNVALLAGLLTFGELARGHVLTGFPWNQWGSVWAFDPIALQGAAWIGAGGLGLVTLVAAGLAAIPGWRAGTAGLAVVALFAVFGVVRLLAPEPAPQAVRLAIVQGNIAQGHKWDEALRAQHFRRYLALTLNAFQTDPGIPGVPVAIWPETASPYFLDTDEVARSLAARSIPENGFLIAGSPRIERYAEGSSPPFSIWNSLHVIAGSGAMLGHYDKHHLVPFGEYVPLRRWLPLQTVVRGNVDFSAGSGSTTIATPMVPPFSPLICYEIIFPGRVVASGPRPSWLVTITNDAWFGRSAGPYQHVAAARLRAVEEGLPVARAANTGISVVLDSRGRTVAKLDLETTGVLHAPLPAALDPTPFARLGEWIVVALALLAISVRASHHFIRRKIRDDVAGLREYGET